MYRRITRRSPEARVSYARSTGLPGAAGSVFNNDRSRTFGWRARLHHRALERGDARGFHSSFGWVVFGVRAVTIKRASRAFKFNDDRLDPVNQHRAKVG